jgi:succinate--hydroxymethylglutarate CoA-transferase
MIGAGNDGQFRKFSALLSRPEWSSSPLYSTNTSRVTNRSTLVPLIESALAQETTAHWLEKFKSGGFPFAPVNNIRQTFEHEHTVARGMVKELEHPRAGKIKVVAPAVQYDGERMEVRCLFSLSFLLLPSRASLTFTTLAAYSTAAGAEGTLGGNLARTRVGE